MYVENLSEVEVKSMQDVVHLLLKGAGNRRVAATHMNAESSRSHSVFACTIESRVCKYIVLSLSLSLLSTILGFQNIFACQVPHVQLLILFCTVGEQFPDKYAIWTVEFS